MKKEDEITIEEKIALRKKQFDLAMEGNVQMLIFLGKQYLGQKDNLPIEFNKPIKDIVFVDDSGEEYIEL